VTGEIDPAFRLESGANRDITSIAELSNGNLVVVGDFTSISGESRARVAVLDDSADLVTLPNNPGLFHEAYDVAAQADGKFIIAGSRNGSYYALGIDRFNADGSIDSSFSGNNNWLQAVDVGASRIFSVGGASPSQVQTNLISDGSRDTDFQNNHLSGISGGNGYAVLATSDGGVLAAGQSFAFKLDSDGNPDAAFTQPSVSGFVYALAEDAAGGFWLGGTFDTFAGESRTKVARINADGSIDHSVVVDQLNGTVREILIVNDQVYVLGNIYANIDGVFYESVIRLNADGSVDETFYLGEDMNLYGGMVDSEGRIYAVGSFVTNGSPAYHDIIRIVVSSDELLQIVCDPQNIDASSGDDARLSVAWRGASLATYQWRKDGVDLPGETGQELLIEGLTPDDAGAYTVLVTDASGSETSGVATITVDGGGSSTDFAAWADENLPGGASSDPEADGNNNGIRDFLEFAFAITNGQRAQMPQYTVRSGAVLDAGADPTKEYLTLSYRVRRNAPRLVVTPKAATDLSSLQSGGNQVTQVSVSQEGDADVFTVRCNWPISDAESGFLYVEVSED
jgi:uncharacterized delta-60 repeat protein